MIRFLAFSLTRGGGGFIGTLGTPPVMSVSKRESITFDAAHTTQPGLVHS